MATKKKEYVIIRTQSAGAHAGEIVKRTGSEVDLVNARRLWYWDGAASLSQLAIDGTSKPSTCKFPEAVPRITLLGVIEVISTTPKSRKSIEAVPPWRQ